MTEEQMGSIITEREAEQAEPSTTTSTTDQELADAADAAARTEPVTEETVVEQGQAEEDEETEAAQAEYMSEDALHLHIKRQANILLESLTEALEVPTTVAELSAAYERNLFCPKKLPKKQENGTLPPNPRLNFYPTFITPETLATYHLFFQNQKIPLSCKINRPKANEALHLKRGSRLPVFPTVEEVKRIFEGLGDEEVSKNALPRDNSHLVELEHDGPRAAVLKRNTALTHFAYPAVNLPPKVMSCVMSSLVMKQVEAKTEEGREDEEENEPAEVVSDAEIMRWLGLKGTPQEIESEVQERRKTMMAVLLVSVTLHSIKRFFTTPSMIKKIGETLHYMFHHGYIKQAIKVSNVDLTNIVSYMGILHENRVGHSTLHQNLTGNNRLDYVRDTIFLWLVYTWQTAMGVWQQCMETSNLKELEKLLARAKRQLWSGFDESTIAAELSELIFPHELVRTLQNGLPDLTHQSMMQYFRDFVLERSGILPAMCTALPTDFVPLQYKECPPPLWAYTYFLQLANYFMYHNDLQADSSGEGLLECYCRCNLCTPHRCVATNTALLNEVQSIGTFELQGPPGEDGALPAPLKLTSGAWTNAYLRKFESADYHPYKIQYYEDQKSPQSKAELTACVITQSQILAQLQNIRKAREKFLLKKGHGVYLDPQTGEELNTSEPNPDHNEAPRRGGSSSASGERGDQRRRGGGGGGSADGRRGGFPGHEPGQHRGGGKSASRRRGGRFPGDHARRGGAGAAWRSDPGAAAEKQAQKQTLGRDEAAGPEA